MSFVLFNIRFIGGRKTNKKQARVRVNHVYVARWSSGGGGGVARDILTKQGALRVRETELSSPSVPRTYCTSVVQGNFYLRSKSDHN
jgi:hypothetical protein